MGVTMQNPVQAGATQTTSPSGRIYDQAVYLAADSKTVKCLWKSDSPDSKVQNKAIAITNTVYPLLEQHIRAPLKKALGISEIRPFKGKLDPVKAQAVYKQVIKPTLDLLPIRPEQIIQDDVRKEARRKCINLMRAYFSPELLYLLHAMAGAQKQTLKIAVDSVGANSEGSVVDAIACEATRQLGEAVCKTLRETAARAEDLYNKRPEYSTQIAEAVAEAVAGLRVS